MLKYEEILSYNFDFIISYQTTVRIKNINTKLKLTRNKIFFFFPSEKIYCAITSIP